MTTVHLVECRTSSSGCIRKEVAMWCCTESSRHGSNFEGDNLISFLGVFCASFGVSPSNFWTQSLIPPQVRSISLWAFPWNKKQLKRNTASKTRLKKNAKKCKIIQIPNPLGSVPVLPMLFFLKVAKVGQTNHMTAAPHLRARCVAASCAAPEGEVKKFLKNFQFL